jgi:phosphohistidine phosphatase
MRLYLVRHGENNPVEIDPDKNLSPKGREEIVKMADFLKSAAVFVDAVYHSGKARALQTAEILAPAVQLSGKVSLHKDLQPDSKPEKIAAELEGTNKDLMLVGHLPYLGKLASLLLSGLEESDLVAFESGAVLCLESFNRKWMVRWMLVPDLL